MFATLLKITVKVLNGILNNKRTFAAFLHACVPSDFIGKFVRYASNEASTFLIMRPWNQN